MPAAGHVRFRTICNTDFICRIVRLQSITIGHISTQLTCEDMSVVKGVGGQDFVAGWFGGELKTGRMAVQGRPLCARVYSDFSVQP